MGEGSEGRAGEVRCPRDIHALLDSDGNVRRPVSRCVYELTVIPGQLRVLACPYHGRIPVEELSPPEPQPQPPELNHQETLDDLL